MCTTPARVIFCIINVWLLIVGLVVTVYGGLMTWGRPILDQAMKEMIKNLASAVSKDDAELTQRITQSLMDISAHFSIAIFAIGLVLVLLSLLGCFGVCFNATCCIILYLIPLGILILAHIALLCVYFIRKDIPRAFLHKQLNQSVYKYVSVQSKTVDSLFLSLIMPALKCCGYVSGEDFQKSPNFDHTDTYDMQTFTNLSYPVPCCQLTQSMHLKKNGCPIKFDVYNSYINKGCAMPLSDFITKHLDLIAYLSIILLATNIFTFLFGIFAIKY